MSGRLSRTPGLRNRFAAIALAAAVSFGCGRGTSSQPSILVGPLPAATSADASHASTVVETAQDRSGLWTSVPSRASTSSTFRE